MSSQKRLPRSLLLCCLASLGTPLSWSQNLSLPTEAIDNPGQSVVSAALNAMGGQTLWGAIADVTVTGSCTSAPNENGTSPSPQPFTWITTQGEFRYEVGSPGDSSVMLSGHGKPQAIDSNEARLLTHETAVLLKPFHLPGQVLFEALSDSQFHSTLMGEETINGFSAVHVQIVHRLSHFDESGSEQDWWFDSATTLPLKVVFRVPGQGIQAYLPITYSFSSWAPDRGGVMIPHSISETIEPDIPVQMCAISQMRINSQPASALFDVR